MYVKRTKNRPYGVAFSAAEEKAMHIEIQRQLAEYTRKHELEIEAMILWYLREKRGYGHKRLREVYDDFAPMMEELARRYELPDEDQPWICMSKLLGYGIDLEEWAKERNSKTNEK